MRGWALIKPLPFMINDRGEEMPPQLHSRRSSSTKGAMCPRVLGSVARKVAVIFLPWHVW